MARDAVNSTGSVPGTQLKRRENGQNHLAVHVELVTEPNLNLGGGGAGQTEISRQPGGLYAGSSFKDNPKRSCILRSSGLINMKIV